MSIEPAGFKSDNSRGYLFWLVVPQDIYDAKTFKIQGKYHWGNWLQVNADMKGRQLALFPGSRIDFDSESNVFKFYYFKAPQAGFAKVYSGTGPVRYFDGYGKNQHLTVTPAEYKEEGRGTLKYVSDPFRIRNDRQAYLPRQQIKGLKVEFQDHQVKDIIPLKKLRIYPAHLDSTGDGGSVSVEQILVNGMPVDLGAESVKFSGERFRKGADFQKSKRLF